MAKVKYGKIFGNSSFTAQSFPVGASQVFKAQSGRIVKLNSGYLEVAGDGDGVVFGFVDVGDLTVTSAGDVSLPVDTSLDAAYELPVKRTAGDFTESDLYGLIGKTCDLIVESNIQKANLDTSDEDTIIIVGGNVENQTVYVKLNPAKVGGTGVA